jgi:hypothetical protein
LKKKSTSYYEYNGFKNDKFYIINNDFDIKITNFEKAYIPKYYGNENNFNNDIFTLFKDIINKFKYYCDSETEMFLNQIYPPSLRESTMEKVSLSAKDLLYNKYFKTFQEKPDITLVEESLYNNQYITGKRISKKSSKSYKVVETFIDSDHKSELGYQNKLNIFVNKRTIKPYTNINEIVILKRKQKIIKIQDSGNNNTKNNLLGGTLPTILNNRQEKNSPYLSNDQRRVNEINFKENPQKEPPVLLEQKVYDNSVYKQQQRQPPLTIPLFDPDSRIANKLVPYSEVVNQPPIQKIYNLSFTNPLGNYTTINKVFEDILPGDVITFSMTTLFERNQTLNYLRNILIEKHDGEETNIQGGQKSLLSYIKIMDINPYTLHKNRLADLPLNFLLYRAAYPVRFDEKSKQVYIAKSSMGINIRIYMLSHGDLQYLNIEGINSEYFDIWREIKYYDWVKYTVMKRKISPNFIAPILYKIDPKTLIDWNKINDMKKSVLPIDTKSIIIKNQEKINDYHKLQKNSGLLYNLWTPQYRKKMIQQNILQSQPQPNNDKEDLTKNSGKILILLTESPTHNIIKWASPIYDSFGSVKKMIATGYHTSDVWCSILFQLVYAFAVLYEEGIYIENFKLEHNVYIKDIFTDLNNVGSWIYIINNIEYYIPNYGYILMIDTKYADIDVITPIIKKPEDKDKKYKIYGTIYDHNPSFPNKTDIQKKILQQFKDIINRDNFQNYLKSMGGIMPDEKTLALITKLSQPHYTSIRDMISENFGMFLHNRIGTFLYKSELENIYKFNTYHDYTKYKGKLMAHNIGTDIYEWVIYIGDNIKTIGGMPYPTRKYITKDKENYITKEAFALYGYSETEKVLPESKKNLKYDDLHIYETYNLDNLST